MNFQSKSVAAPLPALLIGDESLVLNCAEMWQKAGHEVGLLLTRNPEIAARAKTAGYQVLLHDADLADLELTRKFDWLLSIANLRMIPKSLLECAKAAVNFHDGPLPAYAGLNAPVWARLNGESHHAVSWHLIEETVDAGDILITEDFEITASDTAMSLNVKCYEAALKSFPSVISTLEAGGEPSFAQDHSQRQYFGKSKRPKAAGRLDFTLPAAEVTSFVRALDHGGHWNPLATPKIALGGKILMVGAAQDAQRRGAPGEILSVANGSLTVACGTGAVVLSDLRDLDGRTVSDLSGVKAGQHLASPKTPERLSEAMQAIAAQDAFWRRELAGYMPLRLPLIAPSVEPADWASLPIALGNDLEKPAQIAVVLLGILASGAETETHIGFAHGAMTSAAGYVAPWVPLKLSLDPQQSFSAFLAQSVTEIVTLQCRDTFALDLIARAPELAALELPDIALTLGDDHAALDGVALHFICTGHGVQLRYDANRLDQDHAERLAARLAWIAQQCAGAMPALADLDPVPPQEKEFLLQDWNATDVDVDLDEVLPQQIAEQAQRTPSQTALIFEKQALSHAALDQRAAQIAQVLQDTGVGKGDIVGVHCRRGFDMVAACLGIFKAGAAYLPLDPAFPADRIAIYVQDSGAKVILTQSAIAETLPESGAMALCLDQDPRFNEAPVAAAEVAIKGTDLAYLIFTSGSTGRPKGVKVTHGNLVNFCAAMDAAIDSKPQGTWLALTSLSFDISVLELFYTLSRGFKTVIGGDDGAAQISDGPVSPPSSAMDFSLFYWGNDDGIGRGKYELLIEGARFADANGFCAVWTPERHFHAFGGPYPNPAVTGAAVAAVTKNLGVRAGSCVAPLHHTARIAEEWAVIDNMTDGRAGLAIASGWQPDDFVLRPENTPPANKVAMFQQMQDLRALWRGEAVGFARQNGDLHEVVTQPRPISKELDLWVTTAGNPETWIEAGRNGCHVLTHLLGQSLEEVAQKIKLYHAALREAGHDPAQFKVSLMLHSFVAKSRERAREIARAPMKAYLRSAAGLIKQYAWAFPAFKKPEGASTAMDIDLGALSEDELEGILDFAFERYFEEAGLFGTVDDCAARVAELKAVGVNEVACLIDFGIPTDVVLVGLRELAKVVAATSVTPGISEDDVSIAGQILRHEVSHLQCTPSMARLMTMNAEASEALAQVQHLMIGGEAFSAALLSDLRDITDAKITNMYGPTETTIWSTLAAAHVSDLSGVAEPVVNIGKPIANTQVYVLDQAMRPVPLGVSGELYIGGAGVAEGYWQREELTSERFVANPFDPSTRLYRSGDLVRGRLDGGLDFLGRVDHQVKLRGHRIELGEIESRLQSLTGVTQALVMAREDIPGDMRLVAYVQGTPSEAQMRAHLQRDLPDVMMPSHFVALESFPLTPNKKIDRKALPKPEKRSVVSTPAKPMPRVPAGTETDLDATEVVAQIASVWCQILGVDHVGATDNFFDLGGHSLLAVQTHRQLRDTLGFKTLSITDIFRFPILGDLVARLTELGHVTSADDFSAQATPPPAPAPVASLGGVQDLNTTNARSLSRHAAMSQRRALRATRKEKQI